MKFTINIKKRYLLIVLFGVSLFFGLFFVIAQASNPGHLSDSVWVPASVSGTAQGLNSFLSWIVNTKFPQVDQMISNLQSGRWTGVSPIGSPYYSANLIGGLSVGATAHPMPASIPSTAKEVLIYAYIARGGQGGNPLTPIDISIYTFDGNYYAKRLTVINNANNAWVTNSDNFWLPVTANREIVVYLPTALNGNVQSGLKIIGYR